MASFGRRAFHFASPSYARCLLPRVAVERAPLVAAALSELNRRSPKAWANDPVASLLRGHRLDGGRSVPTLDAFGQENGVQLLANDEEMQAMIDHAQHYVGPRDDFRKAVRDAEDRMLGEHAGELIANQVLDFGKQDGVTEIEEARQANAVEQRLTDLLWEAEEAGQLSVPRRVALVPCVSNFSHFLDMCRKVCRNIEIGVPVIVLSRAHTTQYPYRWAQLLNRELQVNGVDASLLTFCSADLAAQQLLMETSAAAAAADPTASDAPLTPFLFTGARGLAAKIKAKHAPGMIASTQGPNLMVALGLSRPIAKAVAASSTIEHSGQCTALRVLLAPEEQVTKEAIEEMLGPENTPASGSASEYLSQGVFTGLLEPAPANDMGGTFAPPGYTSHPLLPKISYRLRQGLPDAPIGERLAAGSNEELREHWRQVVLDIVTPTGESIDSDKTADDVAAWLIKHQPITLTVNGATGDLEYSTATASHATAAFHANAAEAAAEWAASRQQTRRNEAAAEAALDSAPVASHLRFARRVFERSAVCVISVGDAGKPALSAQARPQDGECFGELPPLHMMSEVTTFPMVVPSAQAAYYAHYTRPYLFSLADASTPLEDHLKDLATGRIGADLELTDDEVADIGVAGAAAAPVVDAFSKAAREPLTRGYLRVLGGYLVGAAAGPPRRGVGERTSLYGWQRPPMDGRHTALRCGPYLTLDQLLPHILPFALTNARAQV